MVRWVYVAACAASVLSGCVDRRETSPARTAAEQLLISSAADRSADQLALSIPGGTHVFVDSSNFEGYDGKHAVAAVRTRLLKQGAVLVVDRAAADMVVEISSGALSTDESKMLVGIPSFNLPMPFSATTIATPEIALLKREERRGVAKLDAVGYDPKGGGRPVTFDTKFGFAVQRHWVALLFIAWSTDDFLPSDEEVGVQSAVPVNEMFHKSGQFLGNGLGGNGPGGE
jgi:hypothetical protein